MIAITLGNSYSNIKGLTPKEEKSLQEALSYIMGGSSSHFSRFGPKKKTLLDKKGYFPTGLLGRVQDHLRGLQFECLDTRMKPAESRRQQGVGYDWQLEALRQARRVGRGIISAPTGSGKSRVIALIAMHLGLKTLVVVPSLEIRKQLSETLKDLKNVTVLNIDSKELQTTTNDYNCLIIDEGHHVAAKTYQKLNKTAWTNIYYRFFLTATPFRNDTEETLLFESIAGSLIYQLSYAEAVEKKYIVPVESYYLECSKQETDAFTWAEVYSQLVVNNAPRNVLICGLLARLHSAQKSTLCLVKEVAHGKILAEMTGLHFVSGADDDSRVYIQQFNKGNIKVLMGTTGILGEGIDTKPAEYIVVAGLGKAKSQFMQAIGRGVRTYPGKESAKIVLIKDKSHKFTLRHYTAQVKILKEEYGTKPEKLEL